MKAFKNYYATVQYLTFQTGQYAKPNELQRTLYSMNEAMMK